MLEHIRDKVLGLKEEERRKFYSACFSFPSSQALGFSELMEVIQKIPSRDEVRIFLSLENEDPFIIVKNSTEAEYRAFIEETLEDEMIFTKIENTGRWALFNLPIPKVCGGYCRFIYGRRAENILYVSGWGREKYSV